MLLSALVRWVWVTGRAARRSRGVLFPAAEHPQVVKRGRCDGEFVRGRVADALHVVRGDVRIDRLVIGDHFEDAAVAEHDLRTELRRVAEVPGDRLGVRDAEVEARDDPRVIERGAAVSVLPAAHSRLLPRLSSLLRRRVADPLNVVRRCGLVEHPVATCGDAADAVLAQDDHVAGLGQVAEPPGDRVGCRNPVLEPQVQLKATPLVSVFLVDAGAVAERLGVPKSWVSQAGLS